MYENTTWETGEKGKKEEKKKRFADDRKSRILEKKESIKDKKYSSRSYSKFAQSSSFWNIYVTGRSFYPPIINKKKNVRWISNINTVKRILTPIVHIIIIRLTDTASHIEVIKFDQTILD